MRKIGTREELIAWLGNGIRQCLRDIELADETKEKAKDKIKRLEVEIRGIVKEEERGDRFKAILGRVIKKNRGLLEALANSKQKGGH